MEHFSIKVSATLPTAFKSIKRIGCTGPSRVDPVRPQIEMICSLVVLLIRRVERRLAPEQPLLLGVPSRQGASDRVTRRSVEVLVDLLRQNVPVGDGGALSEVAPLDGVTDFVQVDDAAAEDGVEAEDRQPRLDGKVLFFKPPSLTISAHFNKKIPPPTTVL